MGHKLRANRERRNSDQDRVIQIMGIFASYIMSYNEVCEEREGRGIL